MTAETGQASDALRGLRSKRSVAAGTATFFFILIFSVLLDGCIAKFREPINVIETLPGKTAPIDGPLPQKVSDAAELTYVSASDRVGLSFDHLQTGYWLGGNMWIGTVTIGSEVTAGEYTLSVFLKGGDPQKPTSVFKVRVYEDYASLQRNFKSLIRRKLDISPWLFAVLCVPLLGVCLGWVYLVSDRIEKFMALQGKAEVYQVMKTEEGLKIFFGLGKRHGVVPGTKLILHDAKGRFLAEIVAEERTETDSTATVGADVDVRTGSVVSMGNGQILERGRTG
jgi:hypothetical protein